MRRSTALLLLALATACGGSPSRSAADDPPVDDVRPVTGGGVTGPNDDPAAPGPDLPDDRPVPAAPGDPVDRLRAAKSDGLPALVDALDLDTARRILGELRRDEPAFGWVSLRVGRALAHRRQFREAEQVLAAGAEAPGPATKPLVESLQRVRGRRTFHANRVGVVLPLSGPYGAIGKSALAAVQLAIPSGGDVELIVADSEGEADRAARAVEKLVHDEGVAAIIGPVGTFESEAAALAAERAEVPIMVLSATQGVTDAGAFVFRHRVTRADQARALGRYACEEMGLRRFAILYPDSDAGVEMMKAFWQSVEAHGGEVRGAEGYSVRFLDFHGPIKKLVGRYHLDARAPDAHWARLNRKARDRAQHYAPLVDFDALFIPDGGNRARQALNFLTYWDVELRNNPNADPYELRRKYEGETPPLVQILGGSGFNDPRFMERAGAQAHHSVFIDSGWAETETASVFQRTYEERAGRPPDALAAHAYDAARMVAQAARGQSDRDAVRRALSEVRGFDGVLGVQSVQGDRDVAVPMRILTMQPGVGISPYAHVGEAEPPGEERR